MSRAPDWVNDTVQNFGRQFGLRQFRLNDKGVAAVRFENGTGVCFEYGLSSLAISIRLPMPERKDALCLLFSQAHYAHGSVALRACYLKRSEEGNVTVILPEGQITINAIGAVFQTLWNTAEYLRRKLEWQ